MRPAVIKGIQVEPNFLKGHVRPSMDTLKNGVTALDERAKEHGAGVDFTSHGVRKPGDEATLRLWILGLRIGRVCAPAHISTAACWMTARGYSYLMQTELAWNSGKPRAAVANAE